MTKVVDLTIVVPCLVENTNFKLLSSWTQSAIVNHEIILAFDSENLTHNDVVEMLTRQQVAYTHLLVENFEGPSEARNSSMLLLKTKWVMFCDSDDFPHLEGIADLINKCNADGSEVGIGKFQTNSPTIIDYLPDEFECAEKLENDVIINPGLWRFVFQKKIIAGTNFTKLRMGEDKNFVADILLKKPKISITNEVVYTYLVGARNQATRNPSKLQDSLFSLATFLVKSRDNSKSDFLRIAIIQEFKTILKFGTIRNRVRGTGLFVTYIFRSKENFLGIYKAIKSISKTKKLKKLKKSSFVEMMGGLGNELFQVSAGFSLLKNPIFVNIQNWDEIASLFAPEYLFELKTEMVKHGFFFRRIRNLGIRTSASTSPTSGIACKSCEIILSLLASLKLRCIVKVTIFRNVGFEDFQPSKYVDYLIGYFQSYRYAESIRPRVRKPIESIGKVLTEEVLKKNVIAIHVRLGDYKTDSKIGVLNKTYFANAISEVANLFGSSELWVFSNEIELARKLIAVPSSVPIRYFGNREVGEVDTLQIMRLASTLIISNSTFSWWAAYLAFRDDVKIYFPTPWFEGLDTPRFLIPNNWIMLDRR